MEKFDGPALVAFGGYCQNALAEQGLGGFFQSDVAKEGVDRGQADIASPSTVLAAGFQAVEKISNKGNRQIIEGESGWSLTQPLVSKPQKETEGITVRRDGVGTGSPLPKKPVCKEGLQKERKSG
jgi:hypothetical protein